MMYRLASDFENFHDIDIDIYAIEDAIDEFLGEDAFYNASIDNTSLASAWEDVGGTFNDTGLTKHSKAPDITVWNGVYLILSEKAHQALEPLLSSAGEFLPITISGERHQLFNCRRIVEVDESKSKQETINGEYLGLLSIAFHPSTELTNLICKTRFDNCSTLYCNDELRKVITDRKLGGMAFEPLRLEAKA